MVKFFGIMRLEPGNDPDETWEMWKTKYSTSGTELLLPELKRFTINRIIGTIGDTKTDIYGYAEHEYEDEESLKRAFARRFQATGFKPPFKIERMIAESYEVPILKS